MEYYEHTGGATATLSWSSSCEPKAIIPAAQLYPAASGPTDSLRYNFESGAQSWSTSGGMITGVASSTDQAFAGTHSLKVSFNGAPGDQRALVASPGALPGTTVTYHVWFPAGSPITSIQPYVLQGASGNWTWTGSWRATISLTAGQWSAITVTVPTNAAALAELGVEFVTNATWTGSAYVDAVTW